ncbi:hypothetical protein AYL99_11963 [Fonsecaea erecta]|uniref:Uncharacterized protein n=1 Tax=Fonsecaea erecta TaxID=1367422 RepID=A0A178Z205_9EURO|nr:hypothetical protein AYL99_11963 [Fonsecaea erecta]OAP53840.1 hypothetical protein AYL99_11963 [Fonsecaea erecta]
MHDRENAVKSPAVHCEFSWRSHADGRGAQVLLNTMTPNSRFLGQWQRLSFVMSIGYFDGSSPAARTVAEGSEVLLLECY